MKHKALAVIPSAVRKGRDTEANIILVDEGLVAEAEAFICGCEQCAENAGLPLDYILDEITGCDPTVTEYVMRRPAACPGCGVGIIEKTPIVVAPSNC